MNAPTRPTSPTESVDDCWHRGVLRRAAERPPRLVVKVGGSLLSRPGWPALLASLIGGLDRRPSRIVVGGGAIVDGLRTIDRAAPQPEELVHALAIDAMRLTARLVASALGLPLVPGVDDGGGPAVLDVPAWIGRSPTATRLPAGWEVTSDTIAACAAAEHAAGLLLVKSVPPPPCPGAVDVLAALAAAGWVDGHFPAAATGIVEIGWMAAGRG